ncbi:MAG: NUDIX domain-containing protein [Bacteroidales bacterium]|nr:NUDIX domain-containing protein [Bacteroidales bacterium]
MIENDVLIQHPLREPMVKDTNPYISVDCVIFGFDFEKLNVLLLERNLSDGDGNLIFSDHSLVGHHIKINESLDAAAARVLFETTGLSNIYLEQFFVFGSPDRLKKERAQLWLKSIGRDPEKRVVTVGYFSLVNTNAVHVSYTQRHACWCNINEVGELAFDHNQILDKGLEALRLKIKSEPIAFELLPQKFSLSQLQKLYEVVLGIEIDKRNFRKKAIQANYIVPLNEKQKDVAHKPAQLFMFSRDIYEATKKENFNFSL